MGVDGVESIKYKAPIEVVETISDNAELLPFEQIDTIFKENIVMNNMFEESKILLTVTKVELGMMKTYSEETEEYTVIPVWDFYGNAIAGNPEKVDWSQISEFYGRSFLTINAIDGTVIKREYGH